MLRRQPQRKKRPHSQWRSERHRKFVRRKLACVVPGCNNTPIYCCHLRLGKDGTQEDQPSDCWIWPGCWDHHTEQHNTGEVTFPAKYKIDLDKICRQVIQESPAYPDYLEWRKSSSQEAA